MVRKLSDVLNEDTMVNANFSGYIASKKSGVCADATTLTDTVCTDADTWYTFLSTFTADNMENFVYENGVYKYIGVPTIDFLAMAMGSMAVSRGATTLSFAMAYNGVVNSDRVTKAFLRNTDEMYLIAGMGVVGLSTGDELNIVVSSERAALTVTPGSMEIIIQEFFK